MAAQAKRGQGSTAGGGGDDLLRDAATLCFAPILSRVRGCVVVLDDVAAAHVRTSIGAEAFLTSGATAVIAPGADIPPHARAAAGGGVVALLGGPDLRDTLVGLRASVASCASDARSGGVAVTILIGMTDLQLASVNTAARIDATGGVKGNPARAGGGTETYDSVASNVRGWPYVSTVSVEYAPLGPATLFPGLCCFPACEGTVLPSARETELAAVGLAALLDSLGASTAAGVWSCGEAARVAARRVQALRRPGGAGSARVNVVIVDRALDIAGPASSLSGNVLARLLGGVRNLPVHGDPDLVLPVYGKGSKAVSASLAHPGCAEVRALLGRMLALDERAALNEVRAAVLQAGSAAGVAMPLSAKLGKVSQKQLDSYLDPLAANDDALLRHSELITVATAISASLGKEWAPRMQRAAPAEKTLAAAATDPDEAELIAMLVDLVPLPRKDGAPRRDDESSELLGPAQLLLLAVVAYSLGFPHLDVESEPQLVKVLANLLAVERPDLGGIGHASELVAGALKRIGEVVKRRAALRRYQSLIGQDSMAYEPLVKQIAADLFDSKVSELPDLERATGSGGGGGAGGGSRASGMLQAGMGLLGGMMGVGAAGHPADADVLAIVVLGGVTCEEVAAVHEVARQHGRTVRIVFAGTRAVATQDQLLREFFPFVTVD